MKYAASVVRREAEGTRTAKYYSRMSMMSVDQEKYSSSVARTDTTEDRKIDCTNHPWVEDCRGLLWTSHWYATPNFSIYKQAMTTHVLC
jgi:hypothetical protein